MGSSLQQGIDAAKAGKLGLALEHLKNAVVEEPENPEVWVWFSGIIDDEEKQIIFLKKALELDPDHSAAQRGIAYLQRQKYVPSQNVTPDSKLSAEKSPASSKEEELEYPDPDYLTINVESFAKQVEALGDPQAPSREEIIRESKALKAKPKKPTLDFIIYGLTLIVFAVIGVLIGATIKNHKTIVAEPSPKAPISVKSPDEGVYLSVDNLFYKMAMGQNELPSGDGIPTTMATNPKIIAKNSVLIPSKLKLLNENNEAIPYSIEENPDQSFTLRPEEALNPGRYCLMHPISEHDQAFYWCFKILE